MEMKEPYLIEEIKEEEKKNEFKYLIIITDGNAYADLFMQDP